MNIIHGSGIPMTMINQKILICDYSETHFRSCLRSFRALQINVYQNFP